MVEFFYSFSSLSVYFSVALIRIIMKGDVAESNNTERFALGTKLAYDFLTELKEQHLEN